MFHQGLQLMLQSVVYVASQGNNKKKVVEEKTMLRNEKIKFPTMRVIFNNEETGKSEWKIMNRIEALSLAKEMRLDLLLVNGLSDPPVCKLDNFGKVHMKSVEKKKEIKINQKSRGLKEIYIGGGIDPHDLGIKLKKVKEFLADGHPVKIAVTALKRALKNNPFCVEETTIKVLEEVEDSVGSVQQGVTTNTRKLFTLSPKQIIPGSNPESQANNTSK
mmetsp:Transcript_26471/g.25345  ORF Transcript_26471/g.25345 Transcript_26471/m.25345 type:complete len:218 (-) Transcript_26471:182-835(-)